MKTQRANQAARARSEASLPSGAKAEARGNLIELNVQDLDQLFNTMDPSPFHQKDLDNDAEEFIVSWAREYPIEEPVRLIVHLRNPQLGEQAHGILEPAIHNYFRYKAELTQRELRQLFHAGRISLIIGLSFLTVCLTVAELLMGARVPGARVLEESLKIGGWVAMWHPMEVYLYGWWPLRRTGRIYRKLSTIPVEVRWPEASSG
jgi:hypothetical protein